MSPPSGVVSWGFAILKVAVSKRTLPSLPNNLNECLVVRPRNFSEHARSSSSWTSTFDLGCLLTLLNYPINLHAIQSCNQLTAIHSCNQLPAIHSCNQLPAIHSCNQLPVQKDSQLPAEGMGGCLQSHDTKV